MLLGSLYGAKEGLQIAFPARGILAFAKAGGTRRV